MTLKLIILGVAGWAAAVCWQPVQVAEPIPAMKPALDKRLAQYDPRAIAAARHDFKTPAIKTGMVEVLDTVNKAMAEIVAKQNPDAAAGQRARYQQIVGDSLKARLEPISEMNMVAALDTFTTDELVAMDTFYSSPNGTAILGKMPKLAAELPAILRIVRPDDIDEVRTRLKANEAEFKL